MDTKQTKPQLVQALSVRPASKEVSCFQYRPARIPTRYGPLVPGIGDIAPPHQPSRCCGFKANLRKFQDVGLRGRCGGWFNNVPVSSGATEKISKHKLVGCIPGRSIPSFGLRLFNRLCRQIIGSLWSETGLVATRYAQARRRDPAGERMAPTKAIHSE
jgi:hypothetical protein